MKFSVEHVMQGVSLLEYETLYFDEDFNVALCQSVSLQRELLERTLQDNHIHRAVRVGAQREIPKPVAKILGSDRIEYVEHVEYTMGSFFGHWHTISSLLTDKITSEGTFKFVAEGHNVKRIVDGEVCVKIFGLGSVIEKHIIADVEQSYAQAAAFTNRWLQSHAHTATPKL